MKYLSVCSGIEAAAVAWHHLGWEPVAFSEIEPFPSAVLAHRYPEVRNLGDMTKYKEWKDVGTIGLLVGGTPCQAFSVAGLRKGLDDPRGNLMLTFGAIAGHFKPTWIVWENVPGVLSSHGGRDFGSFLGMLGQLGYGYAYRVLDAQFFGVPQRRRRVFVVGYLGDWRRAASVLFESEGLRGNSPPSRKTWKGTAFGPEGRIEGGIDYEGNPHGADEPTGPLLKGSPSGGGHPLPAVALFGGNNRSGEIEVSAGLNAKGGSGRMDFDSETFAVCFEPRTPDGPARLVEDGLAPTLNRMGGGQREPCVITHAIQAGATRENPASGPDGVGVQADVAYTLEARAEVQMVAHTLRGRGYDASEDGTGRGTPLVPVPFDTTQITSDKNYSNPKPGDPCHPLASGAHPPAIAGSSVRRLTPRECERLQGFPDDWTLIPWRGKTAPDGPRYKACGNSMAVPVMRWIGERIQALDRTTMPNDELFNEGRLPGDEAAASSDEDAIDFDAVRGLAR